MNQLLFRGIKTFWKTKSSLDLIILEFSEYDIIEIIAFDPVLRKHAPRVHVDASIVRSILNNNNPVKIDDKSMLTTFLFNHINLIEYLPESKLIKIDVQANSQLTIDRPKDLPFYPSPFGLNASHVYEFGCVRRLQLSLRDKWRLPLIIVRVSKSLPLRESDAKIWACFVHNKTQAELVNAIAFTLAERVPSENRHVLRSAAHSVLLPRLCPFPASRSRTGNTTPSGNYLSGCDSITPGASFERSTSVYSRQNSIILSENTPTSSKTVDSLVGSLSISTGIIFPQLTSTILKSTSTTPTTQRSIQENEKKMNILTVTTKETKPTLWLGSTMNMILGAVYTAASIPIHLLPSSTKVVPYSASGDTDDMYDDEHNVWVTADLNNYNH